MNDDTVDVDTDKDTSSSTATAATLAAVAAAASANHASPALAAKQARLLAAQSIIAGGGVGTIGSDKASTTTVTAALKPISKTIPWKYIHDELIAQGDFEKHELTAKEAAFIQVTMLLGYVKCTHEDDSQDLASNKKEAKLSIVTQDLQQASTTTQQHEQLQERQAQAVVEQWRTAWAPTLKVAYASLQDLVEPVVVTSGDLAHEFDYDSNTNNAFALDDNTDDSHQILPDLLPPCTSPNGDATLAFFRACVGSCTGNTSTSSTSGKDVQHGPTNTNTATATTTDDSNTSATTEETANEEQQQQSLHDVPLAETTATTSSSSFLGHLLKRNKSISTNFLFHRGTAAKRASANDGQDNNNHDNSTTANTNNNNNTYRVVIDRDMLGLTVENVLERTVVRTVLAHGPAQKAGAQVGSLIVSVGSVPTLPCTHFETIDELRQSQRPLVLELAHVSDDALKCAREEMGRLIQGAGFGNLRRDSTYADERLRAYNQLCKTRMETYTGSYKSLCETLVWMLTLLVVGLEHEANRLLAVQESQSASSDSLGANSMHDSPRQRHNSSHEYRDAAASVAKVLLDFLKKRLDAVDTRKKDGSDKALLQIGDVLQRTRTFWADTTSPPAALLRGELIAFLCDVLDVDTDMELAKEESEAAIAGSHTTGGGMIIDLGSAGSLLKIMVLNCPIMKSPGCEAVSSKQEALNSEMEEELRRRFGPRETFSTSDMHRLHAGNRFLSVVHRLAASRSTSARITACSLGPVLWGHLDFPHQLQLRGVITRALHDVDVIVRKSTAAVLHEIAELVFDRRAVPWLVLMCERAMTDPEPLLRSAAMTLTWHLADHLPNAFVGNASQGSRYLRRLPSREDPIFADVYLLQCKLLPVATRLAEDRSPAVRLAVAAQCDRLCDALGDHWSSVVIDVLLSLLSDADDRVRCEAVSCVPRLSEIVLLSASPGESASSEVSILEALLPASVRLQKDSSTSVRIALAAAAGELLSLLVAMQSRHDGVAHGTPPHVVSEHDIESFKKYKRHVDDRLIPLVQSLLNDKDPEVTSAALRAVTNATRSTAHHHIVQRQRHMSMASEDDSASISSFSSENKAPVISPVLSEKQVLRLLPTLAELADSRQWRVRQSAVEIVPALLGCTHELGTRKEIASLCIRLMSDQVDAVRMTAAECLCMGGSSLGSHGEDASAEWITTIVIPTIRNCAVSVESKQRLLSLKMVEVVLLNGAFPAKWKLEDSENMADTPLRELASMALSLTNDHIANVRLNVGRVLESVLHVFDDDDLSFLREVLLQQIDSEEQSERDRDVLFFAGRCVKKIKDRQEGCSTKLTIEGELPPVT
jgi:hypothetical protein